MSIDFRHDNLRELGQDLTPGQKMLLNNHPEEKKQKDESRAPRNDGRGDRGVERGTHVSTRGLSCIENFFSLPGNCSSSTFRFYSSPFRCWKGAL